MKNIIINHPTQIQSMNDDQLIRNEAIDIINLVLATGGITEIRSLTTDDLGKAEISAFKDGDLTEFNAEIDIEDLHAEWTLT